MLAGPDGKASLYQVAKWYGAQLPTGKGELEVLTKTRVFPDSVKAAILFELVAETNPMCGGPSGLRLPSLEHYDAHDGVLRRGCGWGGWSNDSRWTKDD